MSNKLLILIDGNALLHRSFYALPLLTTKKGELINAVYGFTSVLLKVINELKPDFAICAFDKKAPTFRHKIFKEYKATRQKAPVELYKQIPRIKQVISAFGIPMYEMSGYEADDIIGTLSKKIGIDNIIITGDLDALQLVDKDTKVYTLRRGVRDTVIYDEKKVVERYGFGPESLVDFKALRGDPSDNIPGVPGIGEKTACDLIKEFKSVENIYKNLESPKIKPKVKKLLTDNKDKALLSKKLAKIACDIPLKIDLKECAVQVYDRNRVVKLFQELEFRTLIDRLPETKVEIKPSFEVKKFTLVDTKEKLKRFIQDLEKNKEFVLHTFSQDTQAMKAKLLGISFYLKGEALYIPVDSGKLLADSRLRSVLENENIKKSGHDLKYDLIVLNQAGVDLGGLDFDTMIAYWLTSPAVGKYNLKDIAFLELGLELPEKDFENKENLIRVALNEVVIIQKLKEILEPKLKTYKKLYKLFKECEMPLISVLAQMEINGVKVDLPYLEKLSKDFAKAVGVLENEISRLAGTKFNISSPKQLSKIFFERLKLPTKNIKKTKLGWSTGAEELVKLEKEHAIVPLIEQYRELTKLKGTYIDALPKLINPKTGRIHTTFHHTGTVTGRLSSSDPNLQNIPIRTEIGRKIRKAFIVEKGYKLLSADYSQIDLRVLAHISCDQEMIRAFREDKDIHAKTASEIFGIDIKKVTPEMRRVAKSINFGIVYGMSPFGLSQRLGIEKEKAKKYIDKYFEKHLGIAIWIKKTLQEARKSGYVETLFGRRRYLPELTSLSVPVKGAAERMAINMPIQGTTADLIKMAMNKISQQSTINNQQSKMLVQVHDELLFEIKEDKVKGYAKQIKDIMENIYRLKIPLKVDVSFGDNWEEMAPFSNLR